LPPDLIACASGQARSLPIADLRTVANAGANPSPAAKRQALQLLAGCVSQGKGVAGLRALIVGSYLRQSPQTIPPAFTSCIESKINAISNSQFVQLLTEYVNQGQAAAQSQGRGFGLALARQCFNEPGVVNAFRGLFVAQVQRTLQSSKYSAAFQRCMVGKTQQISASELKQIVSNPSQGSAIAQAFGRRAASACVAAGAKP
jgi:hypothetical protein